MGIPTTTEIAAGLEESCSVMNIRRGRALAFMAKCFFFATRERMRKYTRGNGFTSRFFMSSLTSLAGNLQDVLMIHRATIEKRVPQCQRKF
jgi:hypothetical protein